MATYYNASSIAGVPIDACYIYEDIESNLPLGTTAKTGKKCPQSGVWVSVNNPEFEITIAKGRSMPPQTDRVATTWKLKSYSATETTTR